MNITTIKKFVVENMGVSHRFLYKGNRNQNEEFEGIITKSFPAIFVIEVVGDGSIKSFSYNDLIIGNLKILS